MYNCNCISSFIENLWGSNTPITVFFGTGISISCGNMSANDTRRTILNLIFQDSNIQEKDKEDIFSAIMSQTGQFEDFLMRLYDDFNNSSLRTQFIEALEGMYTIPKPQKTHAFLAELSKHNKCSCYVTTNYDLHFENQIGEENIDVVVHEQLKNLTEKKTDKPMYLKIHGCVKKRRKNGMSSIAVFLPNVSDSQIRQEIAHSLEYVFLNKSSPNKVLFLGYSFSDVYDIVKWMNKNSEKIEKEIFIISHDDFSCKLFDCSKEYNTYIKPFNGIPTRTIPEFKNCRVFMGSTDRFVNESSNYLSIIPQPKGRIAEYENDSTIALKAFFQKIRNYKEYQNYYLILLRHQLLYEVARCCVVTRLNNKTKDEEIVTKSYEYAMNEILEILKVIKTLNLSGNHIEKEYLNCINKRHQMVLEILSSKDKEAIETYEYIIKNMPGDSRTHALMRLRTVFDFVCNWYIAKITSNFSDLGNEYLEALRAEVKLIESYPYLKLIREYHAATPTDRPAYIEYENITTENCYELIDNILNNKCPKIEKILEEEPFNGQRMFLEELFEILEGKDIKFKCLDSFTKAGRPEYVAICNLVLGYISGKENLITEANQLFDDLGYKFGGFFSVLCNEAMELVKN